MNYQFIPIDDVIGYEGTEDMRLRCVREEIKNKNSVIPIIIDKITHLIIDGHHRTAILKEMGCALVPAYVGHFYRLRKESDDGDYVRPECKKSPDDVVDGRVSKRRVLEYLMCGEVLDTGKHGELLDCFHSLSDEIPLEELKAVSA